LAQNSLIDSGLISEPAIGSWLLAIGQLEASRQEGIRLPDVPSWH